MMKLPRTLRNRWLRFYRVSSIQVVLSLFFTAAALIGMLFLGGTLFLRFAAFNDYQIEENSTRIVAQANRSLDSYLRQMMQLSDTVYYRVIKNTDLARQSLEEPLELLYENNKSSVVSVALFNENGWLVESVPLSTLKSSISPHKDAWFTDAVAQIENLHFSTPHVQNLFLDPAYNNHWVVSLSRQVEMTRNGQPQSGVLLVDMNFNGISEICKEISLPLDGFLYIVDASGEIIYHPHQQLLYANLAQENNLVAATYEDGVHEETFLGTDRLITVKTMGYTGWKVVGVVPLDDIWTDYGQVIPFFLFIIGFSAFLMIFVNGHLSDRISVPIRKLDDAVKAFERGQEAVEFHEDGPYEIEHLGHSIRSMVSTMRHLMDDIVQQERQRRRTDLEVLHSQINPHFLYNTLDSVVWMTENGRTEEAILMVTSLARLFRISLSKGSGIISLADELSHANHYLTIQKMRYKNKFNAQITVDDSAKSCYVVKLVVQPILENAIYHGMEYADGDGEIRIHATVQNGDLYITVQDNGPGMPEHIVQSLLEPRTAVPSRGGSGIGFRNVHQRIQLTFGKDYGLHIESEPDAGTTVTLCLPALDGTQAQTYNSEVPYET